MSRRPLSAVDELIVLIQSKVDTSSLRVESVVLGVFYTGVKLNTGYGGVAFTPIHDIPDAVCCPKSYGKMPNSGYLSDRRLDEVLKEATSISPLKSAIGVAAINAVSQKILFDDGGYKFTFDVDVLDSVKMKLNDTVAMVGAFTPYIKRLRGKVKNLYIIERNPKAMLKGDIHTYPEESSRELLPKADVVIVSGASIVNHTIDNILSLSEKAREIVLSGPTASMIPDPLFKRGVTAMGGVKINNTDRMLKILSEGGAGYTLYKECANKIVFKKQ